MFQKRILKIMIPFLLIMFAVSFYITQYQKKSYSNLLGINESDITKVSMQNGNDGSYVETNDKDKIKELLNLLDNRDYKKSLDQSSRTGYNYMYDFYAGDNKVLRITGSGDNVQINTTYFDVSKTISADALTKWFQSLSVKTN